MVRAGVVLGAYVTPLYGGSDAQVAYRLAEVAHGCDSDLRFSYRADAGERPLRWIGRGLEAFGVEGLVAGAELTGEQHEMAWRLIQGQHPVTGEQLVAPKVAVPAEAKLSLGPLVAAVEEAARARGVSPAELLDPGDGVGGSRDLRPVRESWERAARSVARRGGRAVLRVDEATRLAGAAGLDPGEVWGAERVLGARAALYEPRQGLDEAGRPVVEMVERRERVGIAGYDIGINLPKSLSLLLAFAPEHIAGRVEDVYAQATDRALSWTEARTSYVKRGKHGAGRTARHEASSGFSGWVMTHRAARPVGDAVVGDPHWHVHITVANLAQAGDGKWLTIAAGGRELMRHAAAIDKVTQADIRAQLSREFGIRFARRDNGAWEVADIPAAAVELFSQRHAQVTEVLTALGYTNQTASAREARVLTRASRSAKTEATTATDLTLREHWREQALSAGYDPDEWMAQVLTGYQAGQARAGERANETMLARHGIALDDVVATLIDPEVGLTAHSRRFSHLDAITAVADALPAGAGIGEVEALTELVLAHPAFVALPEAGMVHGSSGERVPLAGSHQMAGGQLYTTRDVPEAEREILKHVTAAMAGPGRCVVTPEALAGTIERVEAEQGYPLSDEQRTVLTRLASRPRAVETLEGPPGSGKTTLMRAARVAWEAAGYRVAGAATQGLTAQGLMAESGIASRTVAQWIWAINEGDGLAGVDKLVVDETSLTCDRDRRLLYREAARTGTEILEVLDPHQLRTAGCGSLGAYLHGLLEGPRLTENRRQRSEDERAALALYREGLHHEALTRWHELGQVVATETTQNAVAGMVAQWMRQAEGAPDPHTRARGLAMVAATNEMVDRLNAAVQAVRDAENQLGPGRNFILPAGREISLHVGDAVLVRRNDRTQRAVAGEAVLNGYQGVVTDVSAAGVAVAWHQPGDPDGARPHTATCSDAYIAAGGLELGYCLTAHKAQGATVGAGWALPDGFAQDGSVLVWAPGMDRPSLYVAASRARGQTLLYGALDALEGEREQLLHGTPRDQAEITERAISALAAHADATTANPNDTPVVADLGHQENATHSPTTRTEPPETAETAERTELTEADRRRWHELGRRELDAFSGGDEHRLQAIEADREAFLAEIGPERGEALRHEDNAALERLMARDEHAQSSSDAGTHDHRRLWEQRPHSRLSDERLAAAITDADQRQREHLADAERARATLGDRVLAVTAGQGPRAAALDAQLSQLRQLADLDTTADAIREQLTAARQREWTLAADAAQTHQQAQMTSRLRPRRRDELLDQANQLHAQRLRAAAETEQLTRRLHHLHATGASPEHHPGLRREQLAAAEASYPRDREAAQRVDDAELAATRRRAGYSETQAARAATEAAELRTEQHTRADMPPDQKTSETLYRASHLLEQTREALERREAQEQELQRSRDYHYYDQHHSHDQTQDQDQDYGYDMGL